MCKLTNLGNLTVICGGIAFYGQQTNQVDLFYTFAGIAITLLCLSNRDSETEWRRDEEIGRLERDRAADYDELRRRLDERNN